MLQPMNADMFGREPVLGSGRPFSFRTAPRGPVNDLVLQEENLRKLATELVKLSPELAKKLAQGAEA